MLLSYGLILLMGQISGILFIYGMNKMGMITSLLVFVGFSIDGISLNVIIKESPLILTSPIQQPVKRFFQIVQRKK